MDIYYTMSPKHPFIVFTWKGTNPELSAICSNSHMDTVPADDEFWTYPPYDAIIDRDNKIIARGTQDMKCMGIQYLAAIRQLKLNGVTNASETDVLAIFYGERTVWRMCYIVY